MQFTYWRQKVAPKGYNAIHTPEGEVWEDFQRNALEVMNAPATETVTPNALYYSSTAQAQLHAEKLTIYPPPTLCHQR